MSDSVAYVQFVLMLIELNKMLSQELKCKCSKTTTVVSELTVPKTGCESHIFNALEINILYRNVHIFCTYIYIYNLYTVPIQVHYVNGTLYRMRWFI
jgi:hypothetical protein